MKIGVFLFGQDTAVEQPSHATTRKYAALLVSLRKAQYLDAARKAIVLFTRQCWATLKQELRLMLGERSKKFTVTPTRKDNGALLLVYPHTDQSSYRVPFGSRASGFAPLTTKNARLQVT